MTSKKIWRDDTKIILYSTGCPKCKVLISKLNSRGIEYETVSNVETIFKEGITTVPVLEIDNIKMDFKEAIDWVNER